MSGCRMNNLNAQENQTGAPCYQYKTDGGVHFLSTFQKNPNSDSRNEPLKCVESSKVTELCANSNVNNEQAQRHYHHSMPLTEEHPNMANAAGATTVTELTQMFGANAHIHNSPLNAPQVDHRNIFASNAKSTVPVHLKPDEPKKPFQSTGPIPAPMQVNFPKKLGENVLSESDMTNRFSPNVNVAAPSMFGKTNPSGYSAPVPTQMQASHGYGAPKFDATSQLPTSPQQPYYEQANIPPHLGMMKPPGFQQLSPAIAPTGGRQAMPIPPGHRLQSNLNSEIQAVASQMSQASVVDHHRQQQGLMPPHINMIQPDGTGPSSFQNSHNDRYMGNNIMPCQYPQVPQPQRRLDPDHMPNPIQVMVENQENCGGVFVTNQPGQVPPLVTTRYVTQDQGNSSPRFLRSSLYCVPSTSDMLKQAATPFSLIISPLAEVAAGECPPPIVDFGQLGPVRCIRCKAYISPNMQFTDGGRKFQCLLCKAITDVPTEYFQHIDHTGQRVDKYDRPELVLGTYEFVATKEYCRANKEPEVPALIFLIDVSYSNIKSGFVNFLCSQMKHIITHFAVDQTEKKSKMKIGFITYNNTVHFYNINSSINQPQMIVVGDTHDMFMPLMDGFLSDPEESSVIIDLLMDQIPKTFQNTRETETILYPAIQAGLEALKSFNCPGKLLVFNSSLPVGNGPGKLKNRDDRKLLATEKEKVILTPQTSQYDTLAQECVQAGCSVDLFLLNNNYIDIATIGQVCRFTGGAVYKYTYFQADIDGPRLIDDVVKNVSRQTAFDAVMRVRTSTGIRPTDFYGNFYMSNTTDMEISTIDSSKSIAVEFKHDDKLPEEEHVYIQVALLYTSVSGQRRLRILNLTLRTSNQMSEVFKSCDLHAGILFLAKQSMLKLVELSPKTVKENLIHRSAQLLACYRKTCTSPSSAGQLILPECMKLLPLYVSCLIKNDALSGGPDMTCDDRSCLMQFVLSMDLQTSLSFFYPRLIPIHDMDMKDIELPLPMRCTYDKLQDDGAYILENGIHMFIWLGQRVSSQFCQSVFGVPSSQNVNMDMHNIPSLDTPASNRVRQIIGAIQNESARNMKITLVRQNEKLESVFKHFLIEDKINSRLPSYIDFLCYMHKEIKELLS